MPDAAERHKPSQILRNLTGWPPVALSRPACLLLWRDPEAHLGQVAGPDMADNRPRTRHARTTRLTHSGRGAKKHDAVQHGRLAERGVWNCETGAVGSFRRCGSEMFVTSLPDLAPCTARTERRTR
jgi:hypothetical protein